MARYLLMNKNTPVLEFDYDLEVHAVMKILEVHDARYAPPSTVDQKGNVTKKSLECLVEGKSNSGIKKSDPTGFGLSGSRQYSCISREKLWTVFVRSLLDQ